MKAFTATDEATVRIKGRERKLKALRVSDLDVVVTGGALRISQLKDEWYQDLTDPEAFIENLVRQRPSADLFTFIQRPPDCAPVYFHHMEQDNVAAIRLESYDQWWHKQINSKTRALVRKAQKSGVSLRLVEFDDGLLRGIEEIYNETPMRQGKPFWHYRKDFEYLKKVHETFLNRSDFVGAYYNDELIGFVKLVYAGATANTMHIISKNAHRDKSVTNALIAKAVEICCEKGCAYLVYDKFDYKSGGSASLLQFKRNNGFRRLEFPRYYVPLNRRGRIGIKLGLHHGLTPFLPKWLVETVLRVRSRWYSYKYGVE